MALAKDIKKVYDLVNHSMHKTGGNQFMGDK